MRKIAITLMSTVLAAGVGVASTARPAAAAAAVVGNGLTTTDLSAPGMTASTLASALVGSGVMVSNATFTGSSVQGGLVHLVDPAVVSFNDGVIVSSGNVADVLGPNKSESTTTDANGPGDPTLDALIQNTQTVVPATYDAASLEFDFVPSSNHVYFTYVFGSDEYLEWVNLYNDVFGFFVNGQNCATTPLGQSVSIDTINSNVEPNLYRDNSFANPPANPINIESDGLTVEMICSAAVHAGQTNHMKLAIADTSDHILDSIVMLKSQSLSVVPPESCNNGSDDNSDGNIDMSDPLCQASTTPPPANQPGVGSSNSAPPFTGNEGSPIVLDASALGWSATPDTVSTTWDVHGINGTTGVCTVAPSAAQLVTTPGVIPVVEALCPNDGEYVAHVWGWDTTNGTGGSTFDTDVDFFVHNAPPAVTITTPVFDSQVDAGQTVSVSATVADPGGADTVSCDIDWGDGTSAAGSMSGATCTGVHTFAAPGPAIIAVTATDNLGATGAAAALVTVNPAGTAVGVGFSTTPVIGQNVTLTATVTDPTKAPSAITGSLRFYDGATLIATKPVVAGVASFTTSKLAVGSHTIGAAFAATPKGAAVATGSAVLTVAPGGTSTKLTTSPSKGSTSTVFSLKAMVKAVAPAKGKVAAGTVAFFDGLTLLGTAAVGATGSVTYTTTLPAGPHAITAVFQGSTVFDASPVSNLRTFNVN